MTKAEMPFKKGRAILGDGVMTYRGKVKDGVIILQQGMQLPEGTDVEVSVAKNGAAPPESAAETSNSGETSPEKPRSLYERMKPIIGIAKDLPPDFAINHDHYLYGAPKRQP